VKVGDLIRYRGVNSASQWHAIPETPLGVVVDVHYRTSRNTPWITIAWGDNVSSPMLAMGFEIVSEHGSR